MNNKKLLGTWRLPSGLCEWERGPLASCYTLMTIGNVVDNVPLLDHGSPHWRYLHTTIHLVPRAKNKIME